MSETLACCFSIATKLHVQKGQQCIHIFTFYKENQFRTGREERKRVKEFGVVSGICEVVFFLPFEIC